MGLRGLKGDLGPQVESMVAGHVNEFIGTVLWKDQGKLAFAFKTGFDSVEQ